MESVSALPEIPFGDNAFIRWVFEVYIPQWQTITRHMGKDLGNILKGERDMTDSNSWDWSVGKRQIADIAQWKAEFGYVEEPYASPDGEKIAAVIKTEDMAFSACENGVAWENTFDKLWFLRYSPDNRLTGVVSDGGEWTLAVDGEAWENRFDFAWNTLFGRDGKSMIIMTQADGQYSVLINDTPWEEAFPYMTQLSGSDDGTKAAAVVQTVRFSEGDIFTFQKGCYTIAVNGETWDKNFVNAYEPVFSADNKRVAAQVRTNLYDYTIVVDGEPWPVSYPTVWKAAFSPADGSVTAPVKTLEGWTLARDGQVLWHQRFAQLWHHAYSANGMSIAAIVAPKYGRWTVAVDGTPWKTTFSDLVTDLVISPSGKRVGCVGKDNNLCTIAVDGTPWDIKCDMAWAPVFSFDDQYVAAKIEKNGQYTIAVNGEPMKTQFKNVWNPIFSPDGEKILIRAIEGSGDKAVYVRQVLPVTEISG